MYVMKCLFNMALNMALKAKELGQGSSRGRGRGRGQGRLTGSRVFEEPMSAFQRECRFTASACTLFIAASV